MKEEYKNELNEILESLGGQLDISKTEYDIAVKSYNAVGEWLSKEDSPLAKYNPEILPQGSFMLGTMVKPVDNEGDLDIDLVCKLDGKPNDWTQLNLKEVVGDRIKDHGTYKDMLEDEEGGRRCWTLEYSDSANYHMDILPSIADANYKVYFDESFNNDEFVDADKLAIRITDREREDYEIEIDKDEWYKSNPFGYAKWFFKKAMYEKNKMFSLNEAVSPVREFENKKLPLQRVVQLLKRHRDIMFSDKQYNYANKPISIIITTLAGKSYDRTENIIDALSSVVAEMKNHIKSKWNSVEEKYEKWVKNPVNSEENFADKWIEEPQKEEYFYEWLDRLEADVQIMRTSEGVGLYNIQKSMSNQFGEREITKIFNAYGEKNKILREEGELKMAKSTGLLGSSGIKVKDHEFRGLNE